MKRAMLIIGGVVAAIAVLIAYASHPLFTDLGPHRPASHMPVVIFSGDMGFHTGLSPALAERVAEKGLHVIGVNSLRFAWRAKTPAQISQLLQSAVLRASQREGGRKVIVVGQSYGADLVHIGAALLPTTIRRKIAAIILIVPTADVYYQIGPGEYFGWAKPDARAIDTARQIDWTPLTCIYGREEPDTICPLLRARNVRRVELPGDHYLHHDPDLLFRAVWPAIRAASMRQ